MLETEDMVIFARTIDLLDWLLLRCDAFPRQHRFVVTARLQGALLDFQEALYDANAHLGFDRLSHLRSADSHLGKVRLYLRLAHRWHWLSSAQYEHVSRMVAEIGRLLGGWLKRTAAG